MKIKFASSPRSPKSDKECLLQILSHFVLRSCKVLSDLII